MCTINTGTSSSDFSFSSNPNTSMFYSTVVYTGGTFDVFHSGHVNFLKQCKLLGGSSTKVVVSLNTDDFVKQFKGKAPLMDFAERKALLLGCRYVDEVVTNTGGADSKPTILKVKPNFIAIGSDWAKRDYYEQMMFSQKWLDEQGIILVYLPYTEGISTTELKRRLLDE